MPAVPNPMQDIDLSDDDEAPLAQDVENGKEKQKKNWDLFNILPPDEDTDLVEDQALYNFAIKLAKIIAYIITFLAVISGAVIAKSVTLLMTSQLHPDRTISYCYRNLQSRQFIAYSSLDERLSWTWALYFAFLLPEAQAFLRGLRILIFKGQERPSWLEFFLPVIFETAHTVGLALLVFTVLPTIDAVRGAMLTNALCLVPAILGMLSRGFDNQWVLKCIVDVFAIICQLTALFVWPLFTPQKASDRPWLLPIAAILVSFGWWENFIEPSSPFDFIRKLGDMKKRLRSTRYFTYTFIPVWKAGIFLLTMLCCVWMKEGSFTLAFDNFDSAFKSHSFIIEEKRPQISSVVEPNTNINYLKPGSIEEDSVYKSVQYAMIAQMVAAYICYIVAKFACKISIQAFSFSFPVLLSVPVTLLTLITLCSMRDTEVCFWDDVLPGYLFWTCPKGDFWSDFFGKEHAWVWILWILSQTWIAIHIWQPRGLRLASTEKMFTTPMYNSLLIDQSLALNRRRDEDSIEIDGVETSETDQGYTNLTSKGGTEDTNQVHRSDTIPRIIGCATMWHETREEMIELVKSLFRMDADQCARRVAKKYFEYVDPDYYEFETHILFDDAFQLSDPHNFESPMIINSYVREFIGCLEDAASHVHQAFVKLKPPKKIPTPYGGRLEWILPGKTKLIAHIKDKSKIRHKKRWSQVMYMYYLLGYQLMELPIPAARKEIKAENTFLLAMDGDIDFQPNAVRLLVDLMRKNKNVGAACGRIHPTGSGPMVWYQKFEYAVGHWLQKATEHVFGCVLCSPGCFSLFRGKALMEDNVMARYTTMSTEPIHYVQYDQGEDRWLCTLILQRGYRVEYCAASDAKTHAPEGFNEFYNQRRRWVPSTMANIMDLLLSYEKVVKINPDISTFYIFYQIVMMVGTILGPGTIFLMLVGAFATAFNLSQWTSFLYNFIPILLFIIVCYFCKADTQLTFAQILSVIYALSMVAVIVAVALQVTDDGLLAPSSIFLVAVAASFIIAGIIHPTEFGCLPHGFIYYITIPSMYLLLMIYSLFNLNNVSWGTREGLKIKSKQELEAEAKEMAEMEKQKKKGMFFGLLPSTDDKDQEGSFELSFAGMFKLMCCVKDKPNEDKIQLARIADALDRVSRRLDMIERSLDVPELQAPNSRRSSMTALHLGHPTGPIAEENEVEPTEAEAEIAEIRFERDDLMNPFWLEDQDLKKAEVDFLTGVEIDFWQGLIEKYLKPIDANKAKEKQMASDLTDLRNKVSFAFLMINAVFVILVFLLQLEKETIHIDWPFGKKSNVTYKPESSEVSVSLQYLELEPIGLVFVGFFGLILVTQFIGMCFHRFGTLSQILSVTQVAWCTRDTSTITKEAALQKHGVGLIRRLQHAKSPPDGDDPADAPANTRDLAGRRKTIANLEKQRFKKKEVDNLESNFRKNFRSFAITADRRNSKLFSNDKTQSTFDALKHRRSTVLDRRSSVVDRRRRSQMFDEPISLDRSRAGSGAPSTSSSLGVPPSDPRKFQRKLDRARRASTSKANPPEEMEMYDA